MWPLASELVVLASEAEKDSYSIFFPEIIPTSLSDAMLATCK